jgi:uncharacterized protein (DUF736 family)
MERREDRAGPTAFTRMPSGEWSAASARVKSAGDDRTHGGDVDGGAVWNRTSKDNTVYHSVKLDDPSFPTPIVANLVEVWSR